MNRGSWSGGVLLASVLGWALLVCPLGPAAASETSAALVKDARKILRKGTADERKELASRIRTETDQDAALRIAVDAVEAVADKLGDAAKAREKQGQKLYKEWRTFISRQSSGRDDYTEVRMLEIENGKLCETVGALETERTLFVELLRDRCRRSGDLADDRLVEIAADLQGRIDRTRDAEQQAAWIDGLDGRPLEALADALHGWACDPRERELASAALRALRRNPQVVDAARLAPCSTSEDPVVRRSLYRLLARVADRASMDLLVGRLEAESGVPRAELLALLRPVAPSDLGPETEPWTGWWASVREGWTPPEGIAEATFDVDGQEVSRYFGLRLHSKRILFILDVSLSMDWPVDSYRLPGGEAIAGKGRRKIDIAKAELLQALTSLDESVSFNVLGYGTDLDLMNRRPLPADERNLKRARTWVERLKLDGSTNLSGALLEGFENTRPSQPLRDTDIADTIVVLTDGEPNGGPIAEPDHILRELQRLDRHGMVRIHTVFLGLDGEVDFMKSLAEQSGGQFVHHKK